MKILIDKINTPLTYTAFFDNDDNFFILSNTGNEINIKLKGNHFYMYPTAFHQWSNPDDIDNVFNILCDTLLDKGIDKNIINTWKDEITALETKNDIQNKNE